MKLPLALLLIALGFYGCSKIPVKEYSTTPVEMVTASWYGPGFHGKRAADRSIYDQNKLTAAHKSLPFGTRLQVWRPGGSKSVIVTITDRGPYIDGRHLDLSYAAAKQLDIIEPGTAQIYAQIVSIPGR